MLSQLTGIGTGSYLEAHDDGIRGTGQHDIVLGNLSYRLVDDVHLYLLGRELDERIAQRLDRTVGITLHDDVQLMELTQGNTVGDIVKTQGLGGTDRLLALQLHTLIGDVACLLLRLHDMEGITSGWSTVQTEDDSGICRTSLCDALVTLVEHSLDTTVAGSCHHDITHMERTV